MNIVLRKIYPVLNVLLCSGHIFLFISYRVFLAAILKRISFKAIWSCLLFGNFSLGEAFCNHFSRCICGWPHCVSPLLTGSFDITLVRVFVGPCEGPIP